MTYALLSSEERIYYEWVGDSGPVIVLLNGAVFNLHQWKYQILSRLQKHLPQPHRVLLFDYLGSGASSAMTAPMSLKQFVSQTQRLLDLLRLDQVHLFGISLGSFVGQALITRYPDRILSFAAYANPAVNVPDIDKYRQIFCNRLQIITQLPPQYRGEITHENYQDIFLAIYGPTLTHKTVAQLPGWTRLKMRFLAYYIATSFIGTKVPYMADLFRYYCNDLYQDALILLEELQLSVSVPTLLLSGNRDILTPPHMSQALLPYLKRGTFRSIPAGAHSSPLLLPWHAHKVTVYYAKFLASL